MADSQSSGAAEPAAHTAPSSLPDHTSSPEAASTLATGDSQTERPKIIGYDFSNLRGLRGGSGGGNSEGDKHDSSAPGLAALSGPLPASAYFSRSRFGLVNFEQFGTLSATRLADFDAKFIICLWRWNDAHSPPSRNRTELKELLGKYGVFISYSQSEYHNRAHEEDRPLGLRTLDHLAFASLYAFSDTVVFWSTVLDIVEFRGLFHRI